MKWETTLDILCARNRATSENLCNWCKRSIVLVQVHCMPNVLRREWVVRVIEAVLWLGMWVEVLGCTHTLRHMSTLLRLDDFETVWGQHGEFGPTRAIPIELVLHEAFSLKIHVEYQHQSAFYLIVT